jgi:hypothetical protein
MADVVCAQNFFRRKGTKPILQVTVPPAQSAPQISSIQGAVARYCVATFHGGAQVLPTTRGATASAPKMDEVVSAYNFLGERERSQFCTRL